MKLLCQYGKRSNLIEKCNTEMNETHRIERDNGAVYYRCPECDRSNLWVHVVTHAGCEVGHLSKIGPQNARGLVPFVVRVEPAKKPRYDEIPDEIIRDFLDKAHAYWYNLV